MLKQYYTKIFPRWIPARVLVCLMMFTACWTSYMLRLQMPILAVPMIKGVAGSASSGICKSDESRVRRAISWLDPGAYLEDYILSERLEAAQNAVDPEKHNIRIRRQEEEKEEEPVRPGGLHLFNGLPFDWSPQIRGQLIAAYSYGNVPGNFIGGVMTIKWGAKNAILWTSILAAIVSLLSPIFAQIHWSILLISRIIIGVTGGVTFPACHNLVAQWAPPNEKARFVWSLLGGTFGTILTYPMVAGIAASIKWENGWYIPSLLMFIWIAFWAVLTYDSPEEHPGISDEEKEYILSSQAGTVTSKKPTLKETPIKAILTSVPFMSLVCCHFGNLFLLFFYQNAMMLYLTKALGFELTRGGIAAGLPWAGRMIFGFFFSWAGDTLLQKQIVSVTLIRKGATFFSHLVPGIFLILVGYVGCRFVLANIFLVLALGFNGAASISNLSNNQDLSPNFAGFMYGIMNTIGCTSGIIISPMVEEIAGKYGAYDMRNRINQTAGDLAKLILLAPIQNLVVMTTRGYYSSLYHQIYSTRSTYKTHYQNPIDKWQILFWIGAAVCIACMVVFLFGGSGEIQSWNEVPKTDDAEGGRK